MVIYNVYQTCFNVYCFWAFASELYSAGMPLWGNSHDRSSRGFGLGFLIWLHYNNKYSDACTPRRG